MSQQDLYGELSKKVGAEHSHIVSEIWKTVCTLEEAEILNALPEKGPLVGQVKESQPDDNGGGKAPRPREEPAASECLKLWFHEVSIHPPMTWRAW